MQLKHLILIAIGAIMLNFLPVQSQNSKCYYYNDMNTGNISLLSVKQMDLDSRTHKWFATDNGILMFNNLSWQNFYPGRFVSLMLADDNTIYAFDAYGYLNVINITTRQNTKTQLFKNYSKVKDGDVYFRKDISGNIWLTGNSFSSSLRNEVFTNGKLIGIDNNQNTVIDITSVIGSQNSSVNGFTIDNNNVKWFVAYGYNSVINPDSIKVDGNIYVMKLENDEWTKYVRGYRTGLINDYNSIAVDNINNALWFGDDYYGLYKFDGNDWTNYNTANSGLPVDYINDIAVDENGVKWVLAEGSLIISYNDAGWTVYDSTFTNLNLEFNKILGIDKFGNKWILSEYNGVVVFNENGVNLGTYTVSGNVSYDSDPSMIGWGNMTVNLYKEGNLTYTGVTDEDGNYNLNDVENGTYTIEYVNQRLWGGSDPLDALIVLKYYLRSYNFKYNLTFKAADVNNDKFVNPVDALYINRRYTGLINNFKIEDWLNNNSNYNIVIDGMDAQHSIMFISSGDLNGTNAYE